jgi:hypothetical protein
LVNQLSQLDPMQEPGGDPTGRHSILENPWPQLQAEWVQAFADLGELHLDLTLGVREMFLSPPDDLAVWPASG